MDKIGRLRAMADEGLNEYHALLQAGGEPPYPQWAEDLLNLCAQAEANLMSVHAQFAPPPPTRPSY